MERQPRSRHLLLAIAARDLPLRGVQGGRTRIRGLGCDLKSGAEPDSRSLCYHRDSGVADAMMMEDFEDEHIPIVSGRGEGVMEETPGTGPGAGRRNEDIALDLMKFVAMTTGYGRTTSSGVGFQGTGSAAKPEEYAERLLELYGRCLTAVARKK